MSRAEAPTSMRLLVLTCLSTASHGLSNPVAARHQSIGIVNPVEEHQRWYGDKMLYKDVSHFFQWWYFFVRDGKGNKICIMLHVTDGQSNSTTDGIYAVVALTTQAGGFRKSFYDRYELGQGAFDGKARASVDVSDGSGLRHAISATPSGDSVHITGTLGGRFHWRSEGPDKTDQPSASWNVTLERVRGWYGQELLSPLARALEGIQWNTYAHLSRATGVVIIDGARYEIDDGRAYADMNWGMRFPGPDAHHPKPPASYPWTWMYAPSDSDGYSVIAGTGRVSSWAGDMEGLWLDAYFGEKHPALQVIWLKRDGLVHAALSSDGLGADVQITRGGWVERKDEFGAARVPLQQNLTVTTSHHVLRMFCSTPESSIFRLLYPHAGATFSDFESVGASARVQLIAKAAGETLVDFEEPWNAGVEFGYYASPVQGGRGTMQ